MADTKNDAAAPGSCPCGSGRTLDACCGPVLSGKRTAATAEELMRARFTAHATRDFAFLARTYKPTAHQPFVDSGETPTITWTRLVVHGHEPGRTPDIAHVDFSAYGTEDGIEKVLHENAEFVRENGVWLYTRPLREGPPPVRKAEAKVGRNDPCPCGSGKKYKHCCLGKA
jgi:SEC-C motif-containing protein